MNASTIPHVDRMSNIYNNSAVRFYHHIFHDLSDPRTREWFLIPSPVPGASILIGYLYFVLSWGPRHMQHRKPYQLKNILVLYNFLQVLLSTWLFYEGLDAAWLRKYSWKCQPVDFSNTPEALRIAKGVYIYFLAKISELLDTLFFVLRKKESQITFLHLYHHTVMPMVSWGATKYYPGGHGTFIGVINSFVHIIMYTYYLLAALLPQYQKYLWWKKYITTLQMGQFCLAFLHSCQLLFYDCDYPKWSLILILPNAVFFYFLFADFYSNAYEADKKHSKSIEGKENGVAKKVANGNMYNGKGKTD
ncbi:PREDICTED: elongation of very long chain fatty acids protein AAEL008004 [Eufriesea mexicana]|uniref:elongation of very long chain fatty acids protein AAEL008004 n=1 Tax=Eufriesea mexicana TaxID=516756 RepID=UPI00083BBCCC|nr:PREDICTED: elongation of very long chain fatty acids protein AAEL008004 [Eufriesea mexicana]XP_017763311.1 PREDICTED: elongation of very long chain fatty acids protein AAEL008004 [Eufriesea mexicana]XP_017763312.1 PREDICTED: elongation of very long chain fatty acids protein AAEL008004 [Eufriesea mexicana]XP_017763313.1 PREDICTED: elongation of very long chain fatty acids protein AAEL008004 [Eufriesea mexicana]XP_017763314.1 PREDICTED: elongation of very long chain fatty acids protein AAEL008